MEKCEKDLKTTKDSRNNKLFPSKWTDSGSVSSGVSSDLSSYDTDFESYSKEGVDQEPDDTLISDDDLLEEMKDKNFVQNEVNEFLHFFFFFLRVKLKLISFYCLNNKFSSNFKLF